MMDKLESLVRRVIGSRRRARRRRQRFDTIIRNETSHEVFRGKTLNVSKGGAQISGFSTDPGLMYGQKVVVEFLIMPADLSRTAQRIPIRAYVCRIEEDEEQSLVAVRFEQPRNL